MAKINSRHVITNSERATAACPQKWLLRYGLGLRPASRIRVFDLGSLVHYGLEAYFSPASDQNAEQALERGLTAVDRYHSEMLLQARESANLSALGVSGYVDPAVINGLAEDAANAKRLLQGYHVAWGAVANWAVLSVEGTFSAPISLDDKRLYGIDFAGKVDMVVEHNDRFYIVEHKTTSMPVNDWYEKNRRNPQTRSYAWLLQQNGIPVIGVIYDVIQSKPPKNADELPRLKDGSRLAKTVGLPWTTAKAFMDAILSTGGSLTSTDWYADTYTELLNRDNSQFWYGRYVELFETEEIIRTQTEIYYAAMEMRKWKKIADKWHTIRESEYPENTGMWVEQMLGTKEAEGFIRQSAMCWQYNRLCDYAAICSSHNRHDTQGYTVAGNGGHTELNLAERKK